MRIKYNKEFYCGYSPERINPGDKEHSIEKITKATGIKSIVEGAARVAKKDCGCGKRKDTLNRLFPYNN